MSNRLQIVITKEVLIRLDTERLQQLGEACLRVLARKGQYEVGLAVVGREKMRQFNRKYRQQNKTTDVLSFALDYQPSWAGCEEQINLGDIIIYSEQAKRQAKQDGHSVAQEVEQLFVHGLLHLLGLDHQTATKAKRMTILTNQVLSSTSI